MDDYKLKLGGIAGGIIVRIRKLICRSFLGNIFFKELLYFCFMLYKYSLITET